MLERVQRKGNSLTLLVGMQTSTATMENSVEIPHKTGNRTATWPSNPTAGHTHRGNQNWKRHMYPNVHCSTAVTTARTWDLDVHRRQRDKEVLVHIHNGILLSFKKEHIWVSSNEVDEPGAYYTEWSKSEKKKINIVSVQFSSVAQSCPTLCDPMNRSTPGLPVHHQLPEFTQTHVHPVCDTIQPSHPLSSPSPPAPNPSQHQSLSQWVSSSHEVAKVLELQL